MKTLQELKAQSERLQQEINRRENLTALNLSEQAIAAINSYLEHSEAFVNAAKVMLALLPDEAWTLKIQNANYWTVGNNSYSKNEDYEFTLCSILSAAKEQKEEAKKQIQP